jgi:uncharacterized protein YfbU (UPF0304 family)
MSALFDTITFIERVVTITKKYQDEDRELKFQFEELLEAILQRIIQLLTTFESVLTPLMQTGERSEQQRELIECLCAYLESKEKDYCSTIGGSQFI